MKDDGLELLVAVAFTGALIALWGVFVAVYLSGAA